MSCARLQEQGRALDAGELRRQPPDDLRRGDLSLIQRFERYEHPPVVLRLIAGRADDHATFATAGSLDTIRPSSSCRRDISANEMSWAASDVPMMKPVSWVGKNPFRDDHEQIA